MTHRAVGTWSSGATWRAWWGGTRCWGGDQQAKIDSSSYYPRNGTNQGRLHWSFWQATVCRAATGEGKGWLQGQKQQNQSTWNSPEWVKKRDQPPSTTARLHQRGMWKIPRGTQAHLWITSWAFKDTMCTDLTPAKQNQVTCSWTDTWAKGGGGWCWNIHQLPLKNFTSWHSQKNLLQPATNFHTAWT